MWKSVNHHLYLKSPSCIQQLHHDDSWSWTRFDPESAVIMDTGNIIFYNRLKQRQSLICGFSCWNHSHTDSTEGGAFKWNWLFKRPFLCQWFPVTPLHRGQGQWEANACRVCTGFNWSLGLIHLSHYLGWGLCVLWCEWGGNWTAPQSEAAS